MSLPWQSGQWSPQPSPDPVLVTVAPIIRTRNIPIVAATATLRRIGSIGYGTSMRLQACVSVRGPMPIGNANLVPPRCLFDKSGSAIRLGWRDEEKMDGWSAHRIWTRGLSARAATAGRPYKWLAP